jgi:mRNA interferase MazF
MARGDILLVSLPDPEGHEQMGTRPAIALQADPLPTPGNMIVVIPMTKSQAALRFSHTMKVDPTPNNGLDLPSVVLVQQVRAIARTRIIRRLGQLEASHLAQVDRLLKSLLSL